MFDDYQQPEEDTMELMVLSAIQQEEAEADRELRVLEQMFGIEGVNDDYEPVKFVIEFTKQFLREPRALTRRELCSTFGISPRRLEELLAGLTQRVAIDDLGDGSFEPKPRFLGYIIDEMSRNGGNRDKAIVTVPLHLFS